ncbi:MAG: amidohydrolase [Mailhella sp.]|nr:amidohydrolase [Mailhella sp.]
MLEEKRTIYAGARFITLDGNRPEVECLCVMGGRIECLGSREEVLASIGSAAHELVDLGGAVVYPGFIDTHSHLSLFSNMVNWALCGTACGSIAGVLEALRAWAGKNPEGWILGYGYDDTGLPDTRHLTREDLDSVSTHRPVMVAHTSLHMGSFNSRALELLGFDGKADIPSGEVVLDASGIPTGLLLENAFFKAIESLPQPSPEQVMEHMRQAMHCYASKGFTTFIDGGVGAAGGPREFMQAYMELTRRGQMAIRGCLQLLPAEMDKVLEAGMRDLGSDWLRFGGVKLFIDGSIQGFTAALEEGYHTRPGEFGCMLCTPEELSEQVMRYHAKNIQVAIHTNGDRAAEVVVRAFEKAVERYPGHRPPHMVVHAQTVTEEHLRRMKACGVIPTFFARHVEVWGDRHKNLFLGPERAARIDPCGSAVALGMPFSLHVDTPVLPPSALESMSAAVNRVTSGGEVLGPEQRISAHEAVLAYTRYAALCCGGEGLLGRLSPGGFADFVVLDRCIEESDPMSIRDIKVCATYCGGRRVYEA